MCAMKQSVDSWNGGFHNFIATATGNPQEVRPWELPYDARRQQSREARVAHQVHIESEWSQPPMLGIWKRIQQTALPYKNYAMPNADFLQFLETNGIDSPILRQTLLDFYREGFHLHTAAYKREPIRGLLFCKVLALGLEDARTARVLLDHCFHAFPCCVNDLASGTMCFSRRRLRALVDEAEARRTAAAARRKAPAPPAPAVQLQEELLAALQRLWAADDATAALDALSFDDFRRLLYSDAELSGYLVKPLLEATLVCFRPLLPSGAYSTTGVRLPVVPLVWREGIELEDYDTREPGDADALLLQGVEKTGRDPNAAEAVERRKKKKSKSLPKETAKK